MASDRGTGLERTLEELERILAALEGGDLELDEALQLFERGVAHLRAANRLLDHAEGKVEELVAEASGELRTVPFEAPEGSNGEGDGEA